MSYSDSTTLQTAAFYNEKMQVMIFPTRDEMGKKAAADTAEAIRSLLSEQPVVNIIFAAAPSQQESLYYLTCDTSIDWSRINAFHMDEYIGLPDEATQRFGNFLKEHIFAKVPFRNVHYINGNNPVPEKECARYTRLLTENPVDIVCLGIGENGHIAFNDPPVADFNDSKIIKVVELDYVCRRQQVNEKCFLKLEEVPTHAFSLTIPALMKARFMFCVVPALNKADAVFHTLNDEVSEKCPSTILRTRENVILYLDSDSASKLIL